VHSSPGQYEEGTSWSKLYSCTVVVGNEMHDLWYTGLSQCKLGCEISVDQMAVDFVHHG